MKDTDWKRAVRPLLPNIEDWAFRGRLCYRLPVHWMLIGVLGEGSGFSQGVYIWRVKMPLFIPNDGVVLSWSERVHPSRTFDPSGDAEAFIAAIGQVVNDLRDEQGALREMVSRDPGRNNRLHEEIGYAHLLLGDMESARSFLARAGELVPRQPWQQNIIDRAGLMSRLIEEGRRTEAIKQLDKWCDYTAGMLGVSRGVDQTYCNRGANPTVPD